MKAELPGDQPQFQLVLVARVIITVKWKKTPTQAHTYYKQMANKNLGRSYSTEIEYSEKTPT